MNFESKEQPIGQKTEKIISMEAIMKEKSYEKLKSMGKEDLEKLIKNSSLAISIFQNALLGKKSQLPINQNGKEIYDWKDLDDDAKDEMIRTLSGFAEIKDPEMYQINKEEKVDNVLNNLFELEDKVAKEAEKFIGKKAA